MANKHFLESKVHEYADSESGEVLRTETTKVFKVNVGKQEEFFMVFCNYLSSFYELKYADDIKLIIKLNEWAAFDTAAVQLTSKRRLEIINELGIRNDSISKSLKRLKDKGLISGDRGDFIINPIIFWKGDKSKRRDLLISEGLRVQFNFNIEK